MSQGWAVENLARPFPAPNSPVLLLASSDPTKYIMTDFISCVILVYMSPTEKLEAVRFTTKGQVVIPLRLRKQFDIEDGTKAVVPGSGTWIAPDLELAE